MPSDNFIRLCKIIRGQDPDPYRLPPMLPITPLAETTDDGTSLAMLVIKFKREMPNARLIHAPEYQNHNGMTMMFFWIVYVKTVPPKELRHGRDIQDAQGRTALMHWLIHVEKTTPPLFIYQNDVNIQNNWGMTSLMYWIKHTTFKLPTKFVLNEKHLCDDDGMNSYKYMLKYRPQEDPPVALYRGVYTDILSEYDTPRRSVSQDLYRQEVVMPEYIYTHINRKWTPPQIQGTVYTNDYKIYLSAQRQRINIERNIKPIQGRYTAYFDKVVVHIKQLLE